MEDNSRVGHLGFVMSKVALGQVYLSALQFPCQYDSTSAPNSFFIHLLLTICNLSNWQRHYYNKSEHGRKQA
jgi:hypothetical protein